MRVISFVTRFIFGTVLRFVKFFPNNDPVMGLMLPSSRKSIAEAALFAFLSMFFFDYITSGIGTWTIVTSLTYASLAVLLGLAFSKIKTVTLKHYFLASVIGVLVFDIITGPLMSTFIFRQPLLLTVLSQVPFTIWHLISGVTYTISFALVLDPDIRSQVVLSVSKSRVLAQFRVLFGFLR